jgi:hypothetical protein
MPPQFPNPAQQAGQQAAQQAQQTAQRVIQTNEMLRSQQLSRQRLAAGGEQGSGGGALGLCFRIGAFVVFLLILALIVKTGIGIIHSHPGP